MGTKRECMKDIVVVVSPLGEGIDFETRRRHYGDFFSQKCNTDEQWLLLGRMRDTGGLIMVCPCGDGPVYELVRPFLGEDGFIKETGRKIVRTESHGEFSVFLYANMRKNGETGAVDRDRLHRGELGLVLKIDEVKGVWSYRTDE